MGRMGLRMIIWIWLPRTMESRMERKQSNKLITTVSLKKKQRMMMRQTK